MKSGWWLMNIAGQWCNEHVNNIIFEKSNNSTYILFCDTKKDPVYLP